MGFIQKLSNITTQIMSNPPSYECITPPYESITYPSTGLGQQSQQPMIIETQTDKCLKKATIEYFTNNVGLNIMVHDIDACSTTLLDVGHGVRAHMRITEDLDTNLIEKYQQKVKNQGYELKYWITRGCACDCFFRTLPGLSEKYKHRSKIYVFEMLKNGKNLKQFDFTESESEREYYRDKQRKYKRKTYRHKKTH